MRKSGGHAVNVARSIGAEKTWSHDVVANQKASLFIVNDRSATRNENVELGLHDDFNYVVRINNNDKLIFSESAISNTS